MGPPVSALLRERGRLSSGMTARSRLGAASRRAKSGGCCGICEARLEGRGGGECLSKLLPRGVKSWNLIYEDLRGYRQKFMVTKALPILILWTRSRWSSVMLSLLLVVAFSQTEGFRRLSKDASSTSHSAWKCQTSCQPNAQEKKKRYSDHLLHRACPFLPLCFHDGRLQQAGSLPFPHLQKLRYFQRW